MHTMRRGSMYVIVMATAMMIVVLGIGSLWAVRTDAVMRISMRDEAVARRLASSAVELAIQNAQNTVAWRSTAAAGPLFTGLSLGSGSISASAADPVDSSLTNNLTDPVVFTGTGTAGAARQVLSVTVSSSATYATCLDGVLHCGGAMTIGAATIHSPSPLGSNGNVTATGSSVKADMYAAGTVSGATITGAKSSGVTAKTMPAGDVVAQYSGVATPIPYGSLASGRIRRCVLSATANPYGGGLSSRGIYLIDCQNQSLQIMDCRIAATLVVTNCTTVELDSSVNWAPWETGLPALIASGNLYFNTISLDLSESSFGVNFNPASTPYGGASDSDTSDKYPSLVRGVVYASGTLTVDQKMTVIGAVVIGGTASIHDSSVLSLTRQVVGAPPGFVSSAFRVDSTSWARGVN